MLSADADGCGVLDHDDPSCCAPPLCGNDLCCTFVAFFSLLPSGPLWDYWKEAAISYFQTNEDPTHCPLLTDPRCPSLVLHAIYTVLKLRMMVHGALWVAYRESNPYTAVTTLDNHLARLQWEDCVAQHCRANYLGEITPLEIWTECGPLFCPPNYPTPLLNALKRNVAIALTRANMGVIKNQCTLNWIIDPLGAAIRPLLGEKSVPPSQPCDPHGCNGSQIFEVYRTRDWIYGTGSGDVCEAHLPRPKIPASWTNCDKPVGLPLEIWPGIMAAECIVRSMMLCPQNIRRAC